MADGSTTEGTGRLRPCCVGSRWLLKVEVQSLEESRGLRAFRFWEFHEALSR